MNSQSSGNKRRRLDQQSQNARGNRPRESTDGSMRLLVTKNTLKFTALPAGGAVPVEASLNEGSAIDLRLEVGQEISVKTAEGTTYRFRVEANDSGDAVAGAVLPVRDNAAPDEPNREPDQGNPLMDLVVRRSNSRDVIEVHARLSDDVSVLKDQIYDATGIPVDRQFICVDGVVLSGTLSDCAVSTESQILLHTRHTGGPTMIVVLQTLSGRKIRIRTRSTDLVLELKELVHENEGFPVDQQRFIFEGTQLQNGRTLGHYHLRHMSKLYFLLNLVER
eukprot:197174_1